MLVLTNVRETFNKGTINKKRALDGINLSLKDGGFVTVMRGNGAGKFTIPNMTAEVYPIDSGKVEVDGTNISRQPEHRRTKYIGCVFQDSMKDTVANIKIQESIVLAFRRGQRRGPGRGIHANEKGYYRGMLIRLGLRLQTKTTSEMGLLSGGQRQTLIPLMVILRKLRLLPLDEHTAALGPQAAERVLDLINEMVTEQKLTALMITHNMEDAIQIGNRLIMMNDGRIVYDISGEAKKNLTVDDLLKKFSEASRGEFANDRMVLSE